MDQIKECRLEELWPRLTNLDKLEVKYMDLEFVTMLNEFAEQVNITVIINQGAATSGHSPRSMHYQRPCRAIDFTYESEDGLELDDLFAYASNFISKTGQSFGAVGAYPFWNRPGLHVDGRTNTVYWLRDEDKEYHYKSEWKDLEPLITEAIARSGAGIDFCTADF